MLVNSDQKEELALGKSGFSVTGRYGMLPHRKMQLKPVSMGAF